MKSNQAQIAHFVEQNQDAISALIYLADFQMQTQLAINARREEIALYILRSIGFETLENQVNERALNGYYNSLKRTFNEYTKIINGQTEIKKKNKDLVSKETAQKWLNENANEVKKGDEWRTQYKNKIDSVFKNINHLTITKHDSFIQAAQRAKTQSANRLPEMLATAGSIIINGTPETYLDNPQRKAKEEHALVRELQAIWEID